MMKNSTFFGRLCLIFFGLSFLQQTTAQYNVVLGTDNVPITKFAYTRNGVHTIQTSGNQSTIATTDEVFLDSVVVNDAGTFRQVRFINTPVTVVNNNFASNVTGVGVYDKGVEVFANNPAAWEPAMSGVVNDRNMLHYLFYDGSSNVPPGFDFDIRWAKGMRADDFMVVSERDGNTFFTLTPLDSFGNPIPGARSIRFGFQTGTTSANGNNRYDWNTRFASLGRSNTQPQYMSVVRMSLFNTSFSIHGLRIDNNGDADVKFYGMSDSSFDDNPNTPSLPGITGNIFLDGDGLTDNRVDGIGIDSAGNDALYVSLVQGGVVQDVTAVNELGEYEFLLIPSGTYTTVLGTNPLGSITPSLPTGWSNTGENDGAGNGSDGSPNGISPSVVVTDSLETEINFGIQEPVLVGNIGNLVWLDLDADGIQDAGEPGVAGITVELFYDINNDGDLNDAGENYPVGSTVTDASGNYSFTDIAIGNYEVKFTPPSNYTFTTRTNIADNTIGTAPIATGSDADANTERTYVINITAGETENNIDLGLQFAQPTTASIGDRVWLDADNDGIQDSNEEGLANVTVSLYNSSAVIIATTLTDQNGNYLFEDLSPGSYIVGVTNPIGLIGSPKDATSDDLDGDINKVGPNIGKTDLITLSSGQEIVNVDIGLVQQSSTQVSLGDFVWEDLNQNGIQDVGEPGISGVPMELYDSTNVLVASTATDALGKYVFNDLNKKAYYVKITPPTGYTLSPHRAAGSTYFNDNDFDPASNRTKDLLSLEVSGAHYPEIDAGLYNTAGSNNSIGDYVWIDENRNGIQDGNEPPRPGVTVNLYDNSNNVVRTTVTDVNGRYLFSDLPNGTYTLEFKNYGEQYSITEPNQGTAASGSDVNPITKRTPSITLSGSTNRTDLDMGIVEGHPSGLGSLGNRVFYDLDNDGIQEDSELGVEGVTVQLFSTGPDGVQGNIDDILIATKVTNSLGEYIFTGLASDNYYVTFSALPGGFTTSPTNAGADDDVDSDGGSIMSGVSSTGLYTLLPGEDRLDVDLGLGNNSTNYLGNYVWNDLNDDGIQNANEPGVPGIQIVLLDGSGNIWDRDAAVSGIQPYVTTSDMDGRYLFANLPDGTYSVKFDQVPTGYVFSANQNSTVDINDNDFTILGVSDNVTLNSGNRQDLTVDGGIRTVTRAALGNFVWDDLDGDGIQDTGEEGIEGVTVTLYNSSNAAIASSVTNQNGMYLFTNLMPGTYIVGIGTLPNGYDISPKDASAENLGTDNDLNQTGFTDPITLTAGEFNDKIDVGISLNTLGSVGDYVWYDANNDGIQDANEPAVPGVIMTLRDGSGNIVSSTVTDANGNYLFEKVLPGNNYTVKWTFGPTSIFTLQNVGGTNATNNNKFDISGISNSFNVGIDENVRTIDAGISQVSILPIDLLYLRADLVTNNTSILTWATSTEYNSLKFEIYRSIGTSSQFTYLDEVEAAGNSSGIVEYIYHDDIQALPAGKVYYKLIEVDQNWDTNTTDIVSVLKAEDGKLQKVTLSPNPVLNKIELGLNNMPLGSYEFTLHDATGKVVIKKSISVLKDDSFTETINISNLPSGIYTIKIGDQVIKITKL